MHPYTYAGLSNEAQRVVSSDVFIEEITNQQVLSLVKSACKITGANEKDFWSNRRHAKTVEARRLYCHFLRKYSNLRLKDIARTIGNDHATVFHHYQKLEDFLSINDAYYKQISGEYYLLNKNLFKN